MKFPGIEWMRRYVEVVNTDPEFRLIGQFFTCDFLEELAARLKG